MSDAADNSLAGKWIVDTSWLHDHLEAPDLVILDGSWHLPTSDRDADKEYSEAHIPGEAIVNGVTKLSNWRLCRFVQPACRLHCSGKDQPQTARPYFWQGITRETHRYVRRRRQ